LKRRITILIFIITGVVLFTYNKNTDTAVVSNRKEKETVKSIINKIQSDVWDRLKRNLNLAGYKMDYPKEIILIALKQEKKLQVYAKDYNGTKFIKEYPFTANSGTLGPKLKEGDKQIPEGIYEVEYLNPNSSYHLSIKVSYPNQFDKSKTKFTNQAKMGGDIFIHGKSVTIGCIPIGDEAIEEVFLLTNKAINNGVKVIISPKDFRIDASYPEIEGIEWENELYDLISKALMTLDIIDT